MSKTAETHIKKYYLVSEDLYPSIIDEFGAIEDGEELNAIQSERLIENIKKALTTLKQIDTSAIGSVVSDEQKEVIEDNISFMYEDLLVIQKRLMADEYIDNLKSPVRRYFKQIGGDPSNYKKWAKDEEELTNKFIGMLLQPNNIDMYKNQIKRMALGTMSLKEFKKIFDATKHKMIPIPNYAFESFREYKR
jgi:hypothetical protein